LGRAQEVSLTREIGNRIDLMRGRCAQCVFGIRKPGGEPAHIRGALPGCERER
jgi:hypothetical protein